MDQGGLELGKFIFFNRQRAGSISSCFQFRIHAKLGQDVSQGIKEFRHFKAGCAILAQEYFLAVINYHSFNAEGDKKRIPTYGHQFFIISAISRKFNSLVF